MRQTHLVLDRMFRLESMKYDIYRWYARMTRPKRRLRLAGLKQTLVKDTKILSIYVAQEKLEEKRWKIDNGMQDLLVPIVTYAMNMVLKRANIFVINA